MITARPFTDLAEAEQARLFAWYDALVPGRFASTAAMASGALLAHPLDVLRSHGATRVTLEVAAPNKTARGLYRSAGFGDERLL